MRVADKIALVTGSGKGIGEAIAMRLADDGADVVINDIDLDLANKTADAIRAKGRRAMAVKADVTKLDQMQALVEQVEGELGRIDILVNNAGITRDKSIFRMTEDDFDLVININLKGAWNTTKAVIPGMRTRGYGAIVNIASRAMLGNPGQSNYSASKAGIVGMTRALALELGKFGIRVNAVAPGAIMTDLLLQTTPENIETMKKNTPLGKIGEVVDVANAVLFMASDEAGYITGQTLIVCGGRSVSSSNL